MKYLLLFSVFIAFTGFSQELITYKTADDYKNNKGTVYEEYVSNSYAGSNYTLKLTQNGETVKVKCEEIWGFTYKEAFFRVPEGKGQPFRLLMEGKICYYEDGSSHLKALKTGNDMVEMNGQFQYFSKDKFSEMVFFSQASMKSLQKSYPEYAEVFDCVKTTMKQYNIDAVNAFKVCCAAFNGEVAE
ncbi:MAG: hypothetical protein H6582_08290 [Crocinitomicaceae bacterium]|nr:hypothetical protein [Crocinitomicaceae bacterium]